MRLPTVFPKLATCFPGGAVTMLQLENSNRGQPMSTQPKPYYSFEDYLAAECDCIDCTLRLGDAYDKVDLDSMA
jgi:hypothetical protein